MKGTFRIGILGLIGLIAFGAAIAYAISARDLGFEHFAFIFGSFAVTISDLFIDRREKKKQKRPDGLLYMFDGEEPGLIAIGVKMTSGVEEIAEKGFAELEVVNKISNYNRK